MTKPKPGFIARPRILPVEIIKREVARFYGVPLAGFHSRSQVHAIAHPRQVAMMFCRELTPSSLPAIGKFFGDRDHTTVLHGIRSTRCRVEHWPSYALEIDTLRRHLLSLEPFAVLELERRHLKDLENMFPAFPNTATAAAIGAANWRAALPAAAPARTCEPMP